jgi:hypothetical protein
LLETPYQHEPRHHKKEKDSLQYSTTIYKHIAGVGEFAILLLIANPDIPKAFLFLPLGCDNLMTKLDMLHKIVPFNDALEILPNFGRFRIITRPLGISIPRELVANRRDVTGAPRVPVDRRIS